MKKILIIISVFLLSSILSFGLGVFIAELNIRTGKVVVFHPAGSSLVKDNDSKGQLSPSSEEIIIIPESARERAEKISEISSESDQEDIISKEEEKKEGWSFAVLGDTQSFQFGNNNGSLQKSLRAIGKMEPKMVIAMGDLITSCDKSKTCENKYNQWKNVLSVSRQKFYAVQGNHDRTEREKSDKIWERVFNFPANGPPGFLELTYSFDVDNAHFVILASDKPNEHVINKVERQWLDQDLSRNKKEHTFVFFHEPAYPASSKIGESLDANPAERNALWDILVRYKVDAVFSGHEHIHSRKNINGVLQFIVGNKDSFSHNSPSPGAAEYSYTGNHFALVTIDGDKKNIKIYNPEGKELNSYDFRVK